MLLLMERTLVLIKPLGLQNTLLDILRALKSVGTIVERRLVPVSSERIAAHYAEHAARPWFGKIVGYYERQTVMALVLEGPDIIARLRGIVGPSDPRKAAPGQIRALVLAKFQDKKDGWRAIELVTSGVDNFIHASDSSEAAEREIALWFSRG
ncbi:MAG: nucleoside-diphosphate kinase [Candidatus Taylorbacteria bacterium]|nr:nucleoside-diphosphate kinase [Candidatus Taylorbacteria bacterium]